MSQTLPVGCHGRHRTRSQRPATQVDVEEQLHKLGSLQDAGILTDEEFATKKAELLARL